ncbi:uncharacterized protein LOC121311938, partial [Polyodon spathula]|uniref:uncharacterized protein LOC121311938 n=1 Tax=Polyodon spathula TaxID=7913 RepID=UPI001B7E917A
MPNFSTNSWSVLHEEPGVILTHCSGLVAELVQRFSGGGAPLPKNNAASGMKDRNKEDWQTQRSRGTQERTEAQARRRKNITEFLGDSSIPLPDSLPQHSASLPSSVGLEALGGPGGSGSERRKNKAASRFSGFFGAAAGAGPFNKVRPPRTPTLPPHTVPQHCTLTLPPHTVPQHCTLTLHPHTVPQQCTLTLHPHTVPQHCTLTLGGVTMEFGYMGLLTWWFDMEWDLGLR